MKHLLWSGPFSSRNAATAAVENTRETESPSALTEAEGAAVAESALVVRYERRRHLRPLAGRLERRQLQLVQTRSSVRDAPLPVPVGLAVREQQSLLLSEHVLLVLDVVAARGTF